MAQLEINKDIYQTINEKTSHTKSQSTLSKDHLNKSLESSFNSKCISNVEPMWNPRKSIIKREQVKQIVGKTQIITAFGLYSFYLIKWKGHPIESSTWQYPSLFEELTQQVFSFNQFIKHQNHQLPYFSDKYIKACPDYFQKMETFIESFMRIKISESLQKNLPLIDNPYGGYQTTINHSSSQKVLSAPNDSELETAFSESSKRSKKDCLIQKRRKKSMLLNTITKKSNLNLYYQSQKTYSVDMQIKKANTSIQSYSDYEDQQFRKQPYLSRIGQIQEPIEQLEQGQMQINVHFVKYQLSIQNMQDQKGFLLNKSQNYVNSKKKKNRTIQNRKSKQQLDNELSQYFSSQKDKQTYKRQKWLMNKKPIDLTQINQSSTNSLV